MPKKLFFLFIDAMDYDVVNLKRSRGKKYKWVVFKKFISSTIIFLVFLFAFFGIGFLADENNGLFFFISGALLVYYFFNTLVLCKPFALMALWTDNIPSPSLEFYEEQEKIKLSKENRKQTLEIERQTTEMVNNLSKESEQNESIQQVNNEFWDHRSGAGMTSAGEAALHKARSNRTTSILSGVMFGGNNDIKNRKDKKSNKQSGSKMHGETAGERKTRTVKENLFLESVFDGTVFGIGIFDFMGAAKSTTNKKNTTENDLNDHLNPDMMLESQEVKHFNKIDDKTHRVYSDYNHFTYRNVSGSNFLDTFKTIMKEDLDYEPYFGNEIMQTTPKQKARGFCRLYVDKYFNVFDNYTNYWLDIYRPYDEYDVERTSYKEDFLFGCHCWSQCFRTDFKKQNQKAIRKMKQKNMTKSKICLEKLGNKLRTFGIWMLDRICSFILLVLGFCLLLGIYYITTTLDSDSSSDLDISTSYRNISNTTENIQQYGMCDTTWQDVDGENQLSVLDVSMIAKIAYKIDNNDLNDMVNNYFNDEFEVVARRDVEPVFFHMRHKEYNVDYIGVRGTSSLDDMLQDVTLYSEVSIFQTLVWIFPFLTALPPSFIRSIVYYSSFAEGLINEEITEQFGNVVFDYAYDYLSSLNDSTNLYIVGHSLGGGISQVVAAQLYETIDDFNHSFYVSSFGINSPGALYSSAKFGFEMDSLQLTSQSLLTENDIVSLVDEHSGTIQEIECDQEFYYQCHSLNTPLCGMFENCATNVPLQYDMLYDICNDVDFGVALGARNVSASNFTITYEEPVQCMIDNCDFVSS